MERGFFHAMDQQLRGRSPKPALPHPPIDPHYCANLLLASNGGPLRRVVVSKVLSVPLGQKRRILTAAWPRRLADQAPLAKRPAPTRQDASAALSLLPFFLHQAGPCARTRLASVSLSTQLEGLVGNLEIGLQSSWAGACSQFGIQNCNA